MYELRWIGLCTAGLAAREIWRIDSDDSRSEVISMPKSRPDPQIEHGGIRRVPPMHGPPNMAPNAMEIILH